MQVNSEKLKVILPLVALFIYGLIAYWLIKKFGVFIAFPIMLIMAAFPFAFIKLKDDEKDKK